jgi:hypothetical protein
VTNEDTSGLYVPAKAETEAAPKKR